jgi:hypothetical protein
MTVGVTSVGTEKGNFSSRCIGSVMSRMLTILDLKISRILAFTRSDLLVFPFVCYAASLLFVRVTSYFQNPGMMFASTYRSCFSLFY